MSGRFDLSALTRRAEAQLVEALGLAQLPLDPELARAEGTWKGGPVTIETRAYRGGALIYARFAEVRGGELEIGNALCVPDPDHPLPIFGADLVALGAEVAMIAADLSPTLPPGPERDAQLAPLGAACAARGPLPPGGALPAWCADWFSPFSLYTRIGPADLPAAAAAFDALPRLYADLCRASRPEPDRAASASASASTLRAHAIHAIEGYAAAHRTDDKGLRMLAKMFGEPWAARYLAEVLFPPLATAGTPRGELGRRGGAAADGPAGTPALTT
jgi:phycocyanobilin:ferredoxin oxidoreductase